MDKQKYDSLFDNPSSSEVDFLNLLQELSPEELSALFEPYQQEQSVLDQQMALAGQLRQRGPERSTPTGALLGGLANALGNAGGAYLQGKGLEGQAALGKRMQADASGRMQALMEALNRRKSMASSELMPTLGDEYLMGME